MVFIILYVYKKTIFIVWDMAAVGCKAVLHACARTACNIRICYCSRMYQMVKTNIVRGLDSPLSWRYPLTYLSYCCRSEQNFVLHTFQMKKIVYVYIDVTFGNTWLFIENQFFFLAFKDYFLILLLRRLSEENCFTFLEIWNDTNLKTFAKKSTVVAFED